MEHETDLEDDPEIDVTPQKLAKKSKAVVQDVEQMFDEFLERTKRQFEERLLVEQQLLAMEQQLLGQPGVAENITAEKFVPQQVDENQDFEVTPPIFGLQEGEQLGEHLANILAVKTPKSALMLHMVTIPVPENTPSRFGGHGLRDVFGANRVDSPRVFCPCPKQTFACNGERLSSGRRPERVHA